MLKNLEDKTYDSSDVQRAYNELYKQLRNYTWPLDTVEKLADVEVACYDAFIDIDKLRMSLNKLKSSVSDIVKKDEDLKSAFEYIDEVIDKLESTGQTMVLQVLQTVSQ